MNNIHGFFPSEYKSFPFYRRDASDSELERRLREINDKQVKRYRLIEIIKLSVSEKTGHEWDRIVSVTRKRDVVEARQMFCKVMRDVFQKNMSLQSIGEEIRKGYDHATVLHAINVTENLMEKYPKNKKCYEEIIKTIQIMQP